MNSQEFRNLQLPRKCGVYLFKKGNTVLYVGKATILAERVRSYFSSDLSMTRGSHFLRMVDEATTIEPIETGSVLEAIMLEAALVKKYNPPFNTDLRDNKSFWCVVITDEKYPRVLLERSHELFTQNTKHKTQNAKDSIKIKNVFGPFPNATEIKDAMKIIRRIIPYRDTCKPESGKRCFNAQLGLCPKVCSGEIASAAYKKTIKELGLILGGKVRLLISKLNKELIANSKAQKFEEATVLRDKIYALEHIRDIGLIKRGGSSSTANKEFRIEGYDVAHTSGENTYGVMTVVAAGEIDKNSYRLFKLRENHKGNDIGALNELLERRLSHPEWTYPRLIVLDGGKAQIKVAEKVIASNGIVIPIVAVTKDEHHNPKKIVGSVDLARKYEREILLVNNEAHRFAIKAHRKSRKLLRT